MSINTALQSSLSGDLCLNSKYVPIRRGNIQSLWVKNITVVVRCIFGIWVSINTTTHLLCLVIYVWSTCQFAGGGNIQSLWDKNITVVVRCIFGIWVSINTTIHFSLWRFALEVHTHSSGLLRAVRRLRIRRPTAQILIIYWTLQSDERLQTGRRMFSKPQVIVVSYSGVRSSSRRSSTSASRWKKCPIN